MSTASQNRPNYMAVLEFVDRPAFPVPADDLAEAEYLAVAAAGELAGLCRVPVYVWEGPEEEYVLLQTLTLEGCEPAPVT